MGPDCGGLLADELSDSSLDLDLQLEHTADIPSAVAGGLLLALVPDPLAVTPPLTTASARAVVPAEEPSSTTGEGPEGQPRVPTRLDELKVQELKREARKRQLAVSGSKQQLVDRLRPFEQQILGRLSSPFGSAHPLLACSTPASATGLVRLGGGEDSAGSAIDAVIDAVITDASMTMASSHFQQPQQIDKCSRKGGGAGQQNNIAKGKQRARQDQQGTLAELLRLGGRGQSCPRGMMATVQQPQYNQQPPHNHRSAVGGPCACAQRQQQSTGGGRWNVAPPPPPSIAADSPPLGDCCEGFPHPPADQQQQQQSQVASAIPASGTLAPMGGGTTAPGTQPPQTMHTMTFSFAQMGSGGQFTPLDPEEGAAGLAPTGTTSFVAAGENLADDERGTSRERAAMMVSPQQQQQDHRRMGGGTLISSPLVLPEAIADRRTNLQQQQAAASASGAGCLGCKQQHFSPASSLPQCCQQQQSIIPCCLSDELTGAGGLSRRRHSVEGCWAAQQQQAAAAADSATAGELLSAATLARHEELLRQQQRRIQELQRELGRSQLALHQHQQLVADARKSLVYQDPETGRVVGQTEFWLAQLECVHAEQQRTLDRQTGSHRALCCAEQRLQEEMHTEQAVQDIVRLIRQEPRTALLIVQLLRRYQLERCSSTGAVGVTAAQQPASSDRSQSAQWTCQGRVDSQQNGSAEQHHQRVVRQPKKTTGGRKRPAVSKRRTKAKTTPTNTAKATSSFFRSNSVLDGQLTGGCVYKPPEDHHACDGGPTGAKQRRPNSSLGTEGRHPRAQQQHVDMEAIFRSVLLEGGGDAGGQPPRVTHHEDLLRQQQQQGGHESMIGGTGEDDCCSSTTGGHERSPPIWQQQEQQQQHPSALIFPMATGADGQQPSDKSTMRLFPHSQEMDDLMEVLRDDQEGNGQQQQLGSVSLEDSLQQQQLFDTDQLATLLAEEVEHCRRNSSSLSPSCCRISSSAEFSAALAVQGPAMAASIRLPPSESVVQQHRGYEREMGPEAADNSLPTTITMTALFEEDSDRMDCWLDGFDLMAEAVF